MSVLGNRYIGSFLSTGAISKAFAILSDRRLYFRGTNYIVSSGRRKLTKTKKSAIVDLCDITGTEILYEGSVLPLIMGILLIAVGLMSVCAPVGGADEDLGFYIGGLSFLLAIISFFVYFKQRKHTQVINYGGGGIACDVHRFTHAETEEFRKAMHLAKDRENERRYGNF